MDRRGIPSQLVKVIKNVYINTKKVIGMEINTNKIIKINSGIRQGGGLSPSFFNVYIDEVVREWTEFSHLK